jgi:hypothetical protein
MEDIRAAISRTASGPELEALAAGLEAAIKAGVDEAGQLADALDEVNRRLDQRGTDSGGGSSASPWTRVIANQGPAEQVGSGGSGQARQTVSIVPQVRTEIAQAEALLLDFQRRMASQPLQVPFTLQDRTADAIALAAMTQGVRR